MRQQSGDSLAAAPGKIVRAHAFLYQLGADGRVVEVGSEVQDYGYRPEDIIGHELMEFVHPDDRDRVAVELRESLREGASETRFHLRLLTRPAGERAFLITATLLTTGENGHSRRASIQGYALDVDACRLSNHPYWPLFQNDTLPMATILDGRFSRVTPSLTSLLDTDPDSLIGQSVTDVVRLAGDGTALSHLLHPPPGGVGPREGFIGLPGQPSLLVRVTSTLMLDDDKPGQLWLLNPVLDEASRSEAVAQVEQRFRQLVEMAEESILLIQGGVFADCNQQTTVLFGRPREEMIGTHPADPRLSPPKQPSGRDSRTAADEVVRAAMEGQPQRFIWEHLRGDGSPVQVEVSLKRISAENNAVICVQRDITEQLRQQEALKASEERFRRIFDDAEIGIVLTDEAGQFLKVNPHFCNLVGYSEEDLLSTSFHMLQFPEDDRTEELRRHAELIEGKRRFYKLRKRYRHRDGHEVITDILVNKVVTSDGAVHHMGLIQDRTASVLTEREREELHQQLVQAQKMEEIGRITGGIAHDFNNLLTALQGHVDITDLSLQQDTPPVESLRGHVHEMKQTVQRAASLTRQLLAFSRSQVATPKPTDLNRMVEDLQKMLRRVAPATVDLQLDLTPELGAVFIDPTQLTQVILNLSTNAIDAMPDGGTLTYRTSERISSEEDPIPLRQGTVSPGMYLVLEVEDTGIGIEPDILAKVFDPFFTTKDPGKGTGLGLSTSMGLIKSAGGFLDVRSSYGQGSTFSLYLPRSRSASESTEEAEQSIRGGAERILVVEDEDIIRRIVDRMLRMAGYETLIFPSAEAALSHVTSHDDWPDLLLTDIVLPKRSGTELLLELRAMKPDLKVICMSGYTRDSDSLRTVMDQKLPFLPKPFKREQLLEMVRGTLDGEAYVTGDA